MAGRKNGNAAKAENERAVKGDNSEKANAARLAESHEKMREFGRMARDGKSAKQNAVERFREDCLLGVAGPHLISTYIDWYDEGAKMSGSSRKSFASQISAFGDSKVIAAYPKFAEIIDRLHAAKDKDVSRKETDKDKFSQLYKIAGRIQSEGPPVTINDEYVKKTIAKKVTSNEDLEKAARAAIWDSVKRLLGEKPSKAQTEARDLFFKTFKIEEPVKA